MNSWYKNHQSFQFSFVITIQIYNGHQNHNFHGHDHLVNHLLGTLCKCWPTSTLGFPVADPENASSHSFPLFSTLKMASCDSFRYFTAFHLKISASCVSLVSQISPMAKFLPQRSSLRLVMAAAQKRHLCRLYFSRQNYVKLLSSYLAPLCMCTSCKGPLPTITICNQH